MYLLISFDWQTCFSSSKELLKERPLIKQNVSEKIGEKHAAIENESDSRSDLVWFILKRMGKAQNKGNLIIEYFFNCSEGRNSKFVGSNGAIALLAYSLDMQICQIGQTSSDPFTIIIPEETKNMKVEKLIKDPSAFTAILTNLPHHFTDEGVKSFITTMSQIWKKYSRFAQEVAESKDIVKLIFEIADYFTDENLFYIQKDLLYILTDITNLIRGKPEYQLTLINECLSSLLQICHKNPENFGTDDTLRLLQYAYLIEDLILKDPNLLKCKTLLTVMSRLLIILDKSDLLYISLPVIEIFDPRPVVKQKTKALREGGFVRILLKFLFLLVIFDKRAEYPSLILLRFFIFRDKTSRKQTKSLSGIALEKKKKSNGNIERLNIFDFLFKNSSEKMNQYNKIVKNFLKKIISKDSSFLDNRPVEKSSLDFPNEKNMFTNGILLILHIFAEIFQLLFFELLSVTSYVEIANSDQIRNNYLELINGKQPWTSKFKQIAQVLQDIIRYNQSKILERSITKQFSQMVELIRKKQINIRYLRNPSINLLTVYSSLSTFVAEKNSNIKLALGLKQFEEAEKQEDLLAGQDKDIENFTKSWEHLVEFLFIGMKNSLSIEVSCELISSLIVKEIHLQIIQPYLHFFTTHTLFALDKSILQSATAIKEKSELADVPKIHKDFENRIREKFCLTPIPTDKIERDELRKSIGVLANEYYKKIYREQQSEVNAWYDKKLKKQSRDSYKFIEFQYNKVLKKCPLHRKLASLNKYHTSSLKEFTALSKRRDEVGRSMIAKRLSKIEDKPLMGYNFSYLRQFTIKKFLILSVLEKEKKISKQELFAKDFIFPLQKSIFSNTQIRPKRGVTQTKLPEEIISKNSTQISVLSTKIDFCSINKEKNHFDAEIITIQGVIFGRLSINLTCLSFKSEQRKEDDKYKFGAPSYQLLKTTLNKKWKTESIKEIVVKRYNLLRQAIEIYFDNSPSILISLFDKSIVKKFLNVTRNLTKKKKDLHIEIVDKPEKYVTEMKFQEAWVASKITNFEYLMILNKYGGRSFNDINQYPIFPWVISNYENPCIDLSDPKIYRDLQKTIGGISEKKREQADEKLDVLINCKGCGFYQIGTHYLPGRVVLGFFLRIEPYSSMLLQFDKGHDAAARMFHEIKKIWESGTIDIADNKELIPEFYYLPEMFINYNKYSYGTKLPNEDAQELIQKTGEKIRVDDVLMPAWAQNHHQYVKMNALALESSSVSFSLHNWIDLIFGEKQQDQKYYNRYKELCDEKYFATIVDKVADSKITEIQEFGTIPIQLFRDKHPPKNDAEYKFRLQHSLFYSERKNGSHVFALLKINQFQPYPVTYIKATKNRIYVVLNNQTLYRSQEEYINTSHEKPLEFEKKSIKIFPYRKINMEPPGIDIEHCFAFLCNGKLAVTCRNYDNTCKIILTDSGEIFLDLIFHYVKC